MNTEKPEPTNFVPSHQTEYTYSAFAIIADVLNHNYRLYPYNELFQVCKAFKDRKKDLYGQFGISSADTLKIDLDKVSHEIIHLSMEPIINQYGHFVLNDKGEPCRGMKVEIKTLPTPSGVILKKMLDSGIKLYPLCWGSGQVSEKTKSVFDYRFFTIDIDLKQNIWPTEIGMESIPDLPIDSGGLEIKELTIPNDSENVLSKLDSIEPRNTTLDYVHEVIQKYSQGTDNLTKEEMNSFLIELKEAKIKSIAEEHRQEMSDLLNQLDESQIKNLLEPDKEDPNKFAINFEKLKEKLMPPKVMKEENPFDALSPKMQKILNVKVSNPKLVHHIAEQINIGKKDFKQTLDKLSNIPGNLVSGGHRSDILNKVEYLLSQLSSDDISLWLAELCSKYIQKKGE